MPRITQAPPPGIVRNATAEATPGRWWDANNIRWRGNVLQPVGGNIMLPNATVSDLPRDLITWHDNQHQRWAAFGTDTKLYAYSFDQLTVTDITPAGIPALGQPGSFNGYGLSTFGTGLYGTPRSSGQLPPGIIGTLGDWWSMDTFGEDLLVVPTQDGRLYRWSPLTPTTPAAVVANAPVANRGVIVTDQRHVVLYGADGDPRNVAWSDQEDPNTWTPDVTNLAGSLLLNTQAVALTAIKVPQGVLIFTTNDVHMLAYVGAPYAYGLTQIGAGCGPISARAPVAVGGFAAWPSWQNFWMFNGNVQPFQCDVKDWFFASINQTIAGLTFGSANPQFSELWWDWPDQSSTVCNRYIAVNFGAPQGDAHPWLIGRRIRTAGDRKGTMAYPVLGGAHASGGALFQHEYGYLDDDSPRASAEEVYVESGNIVVGEGDNRFNVNQIVYDGVTDPANPAFGLRFYCREQPFDQREFDTGLYTAIGANGLMDCRFSGRSVRMRVQATRDVPWELGRLRLSGVPAGRR
jgi:hypothetical protein